MPKSNQPSRRLWPSYVFFAATVACLCVTSGCGYTSGTISGPPPNLVVTPSLASMPSGWTQQFSANISGASSAVSWAVNGTIGGSSSTGTITTSGVYIAPQVPPVPATVKITAVSQTDSSLIGSVSLKVTGLFAYVTNQSDGTLSAYRVDTTGTLIPLDGSPFVTGKTPFFLVANAHKNLYVTDMNASDIYTYAIDQRSGALTQVGLPVTVGSGPRAIAIHPSGTALYVACTDGAGIYGFSIDATSGALTALPGSPFRNLGLRPAAITFDPSGKYAFVPNNASKNVSVLSVDLVTGKLTSIEAVASGTAPVWASTDASGAYLYVLSDVDDKIYAYSASNNGNLSPLANPTFPEVADPLSATLSPNGKFLYVTNWFANVGAPFPGSTVSVFSIDPTNGNLIAIAGSPFAAGLGPTSLAFEPGGKFAFVTNELAGTISGFSVNSSTGAMTVLPAAIAAGLAPTTIAVVATNPE